MANSVASLVVQTELLPTQTPSPLSSFPSLLNSSEEGDTDGGKVAEEEKKAVTIALTGVEMVTSSTSPVTTTASQNPEHPFQCLDCGKSFKWSSRLAHHQRSHNNERPYCCNLCPKAFKGSSALLYHQRSHSGEKPYKCDDCGKAFKRSSLLQVHRSVHTGLRTFQCPYCPLTFKWSSHYQYHLRQHTGESPYQCDRCPKAFKNSSSLRRHKNVHLGVKPYICVVCSKAFSQSTNLRQHMRIHTGERPYVCDECGRSFTHSSNLALHRNSHTEDKSKCGIKQGKVGTGTDMEVVLQGATMDDLRGVEMTISDMVGLVSGQEGEVGQVFLSHHVASSISTSTKTSQNVNMETPTDTGATTPLYSCGSCSETFTTQTCLEEHQALHLHSLGAEDADEVTTVNSIDSQGGAVSLIGMAPLLADFEEVVETTESVSKQRTEILTLGSIGSESGQTQYDLLQSFTTSVAQIPSDDTDSTVDTSTVSECAYCSKRFKNNSSLSRHMAQAHHVGQSQSRSQFSCSVCDHSFSQLSTLLTHQLSHTEEQRMLAEAEAEIVCPPSLSLSLPLSSSPSAKAEDENRDHEREIHVSLIAVTEERERQATKLNTGVSGKPVKRGGNKISVANNERPYRCLECGKSFKGSSGLRYHMRDHTGEKPYRCTECGKSFKRSSLLSIHQRVHTGVRAFQCPYCPLTFKWSSHYQYHLRQHTGERPYVCQECGKSFKNTSCLRRHSQLHSGLRPHACSVCGKAFSQTSNLRQHERTHSGERPFQCPQCHKSFTHSSNLQLHLRTHSLRKDFKCNCCGKEFVMHSYLQRHLRTHNVSGGAEIHSKDGKVNKSVSAASEMSTNLNMKPTGGLSSLFSADGKSTVLLSSSNLDLPPNTSQNYFMIQTTAGLQLIPLSNPVPTQPVPTPPPPPPQLPSQNYLLLQCQSSNGSQPNLILVPTASSTNTSSAPTVQQPLNIVQTLPAVQQILAPAQIPQFQTLQTQQRFIFTNNSSPILTASSQNATAITRPILGTLSSGRSTRTRRGRKPKAKGQKSSSLSQTQETVSTVLSNLGPTSVQPSTTLSDHHDIHVPMSVSPLNSVSISDTPSDPTAVTGSAVTSTTSSTENHSSSKSVEVPTAEMLPESFSGKHYVLCLKNETKETNEGDGMVDMGDGGEEERSYVLHFEGEAEQREEENEGRGEKSYVLQFEVDKEIKGDGGNEKTGMVSLNLLQEWAGDREGERIDEVSECVDTEEKSFVLHFQTDAPNEDISSSVDYTEGQREDLQFSCHSAQTLMPLDGQEVVFELDSEGKIHEETGSGENVQMIALIEGECGGSETKGGFTNSVGSISSEGGQMDGIFQLEDGERIVIIEVSTSSLGPGADRVSLGLRNEQKEESTEQETSHEQKLLETESRLLGGVTEVNMAPASDKYTA